MKKMLTFAAALLVVSNCFAAGETVYVDSIAIMQSSVEGKEVMAKLQKEIDAFQEDVKRVQKDLQDEQDALNKQVKVLSKEAMQEKAEQLNQKRKKAERDFAGKEEELRASLQKKQIDLRDRQLKSIRQISEKEGWAAVLDKNTPGLLCVSNGLDKTESVSKAVDEMYKANKSSSVNTVVTSKVQKPTIKTA